MNFIARHSAITINSQILQHKSIIFPKTFFNSNSSIDTLSPPSFNITKKPINRRISLHSGVYPLHNSSQNPSNTRLILNTLILCVFSFTLICLRLVSNTLLPDFPNRWKQLIAFSVEAGDDLFHCPYLWLAVVAYEDIRFFTHRGIDPVGIARAVLSFSALGGGSTVTQHLIKNTLLKNERTFLRKVIEIVLALALERRISKPRILSSYLCKIYWGHGVYGIELASHLYFGKHPSLLSLGECELLVGIIPAPEL